MFGQELKDFLHEYAHTAAWWAHAEGLPDERNRITLDPKVRDARGLPAALKELAPVLIFSALPGTLCLSCR